MAYVLAVLMAALSFLLNRAALKYIGLKAIISWVPVVEEAAKTVPAFYLGADVLLTHALFGLVEAGYDWRASGGNGPVAALLSVTGHSLFGALTTAILYFTGNLMLALGAAVGVHIAWNVVLIRVNA